MSRSTPMRFAYLVLALVACKKAEPTPPATPPDQARDAAVASADAPAIDAAGAAQLVDVELVQLTAATVRVSSQVANPNIKPTHLVDKNLSTAWNSVTGELVGAWIEIRPIDGAEIHTVKLTPGFTAKGPKGEDWFTMNPRIRKLRVLADGQPQPDIYLDVDKRELQAFPITATDSVRLEVREIVEGTKKKWREISVSELEAWGTTPAGWSSPRPLPSITVEVGEAAPRFDPCAGIEERRAEVEEEGRRFEASCEGNGCEDHNYPPLCSVESADVAGTLDPRWASYVVWCESNDEIYGPSSCNVRFEDGMNTTVATYETARGRPSMTTTLAMQEVIAAAPGDELVVELAQDDDHVATVICRADTYKCSEAIEDVAKGAKLSAQPWVFK